MDDDLEQLVVLEGLGFEEAWVGEHFTAEWENIPCPDLFIAQALGVTRRMKLGTGVSCLPNHDPLMLAQRIAQLDQMARGRFLWGVGSGGFPGDFELFELDPKAGEHRTVTRASLDLILDLWNDPKPGVYERAPLALPRPRAAGGHRAPAPPPPVPAAPPADRRGRASAEKSDTLILAGERGYIPMSINFVPPRVAQDALGRRSSGSAAGRPGGRSRHVAHRARRLRRRDRGAGAPARRWPARWPATGRTTSCRCSRSGAASTSPRVDPAMPDNAVTLEYLADNIWLVGDPDEVARQLAPSARTSAVSARSWSSATSGRRGSLDRSMRLLADEVLPRL